MHSDALYLTIITKLFSNFWLPITKLTATDKENKHCTTQGQPRKKVGRKTCIILTRPQ